MLEAEIRVIVRDRLERWGRVCRRAHATPALLLAVGHDGREGELSVCVPDDDCIDHDLPLLLRAVADMIESGDPRVRHTGPRKE